MTQSFINNKYNRKRKLFPYIDKQLPSGFLKPTFNHLALPKYNELIQNIITTAQDNNIKINLLIKTWNEKTQIPLRKAKNILKGSEEIDLWEYILLCEILNIEIIPQIPKKPKYQHSIESSAFGRKLIIQSNSFLKLIVTLDLDDITNINVTFFKTPLMNINQVNCKRETLNALLYYFKEKLPFTNREFNLIFRTKWINNQFRFKD